MIAMLFVTLLGATLLYTAYTGYLVKLTDRGGKKNFYDATAMMDQVVAGLQETASESIAGAYSQVLAEYSNLSDPERAFADAFRKEMLPADSDQPIYTVSGTNRRYNVAKLFDYADVPADASMTLNGYGGPGDAAAPGTVKLSADGTTITLEKVSITYEHDGYETNVTTDICIDMPEFYQYSGEYAVSGLPNYALVAQAGLTVDSGVNSAQIAGNAYAGQVQVKSGTMTLGGKATLISGGAVSLTQGTAQFSQERETSLWASDLVLGGNTAVTLQGSSYLADDLELRSGAKAVLAGDYYGFGYDEEDPDANSAILANGRGTELDLENAKVLSLAGNSFVRATTGGSSLFMGDSIAAKSEQRLYLIPDKYLDKDRGMTSNPMVVRASSQAELELDNYSATLPTEQVTRYGASVTKLVYPLGTETTGKQYVIYLFMKFDTVDHANAFFKDYFEKDPAAIRAYLSGYLNISGQATALKSRGYVLADSGELLGGDGEKFVTRTSDRLAGFYKNLCVSLTTNKTSATATNPYEYYVNDGKVRTAPQPVTTLGDGRSWVVSSGGYTVDSASAPALIIAAGNVTVSEDYQGLILCGGTVTVKNGATIRAGENMDPLLLAAQAYLVNYGSNSTPEENVPEKKPWALDELVYYRNWSKQ